MTKEYRPRLTREMLLVLCEIVTAEADRTAESWHLTKGSRLLQSIELLERIEIQLKRLRDGKRGRVKDIYSWDSRLSRDWYRERTHKVMATQ